MEDFPEEFNVDAVPDTSLVPDGEYLAQIIKHPVETTKNGDGKYLALTWKILEGDQEGRLVWQNVTLTHPSPAAVGFGQRMLKQIALATKAPPTFRNAEVLAFIPVTIMVGREVDKRGEYPDKNKILRVSSVDGEAQEAAPAIGPAPSRPSAPARPSGNGPGPAPWHRT